MGIKESVKRVLVERQEELYRKKLQAKKDPYADWFALHTAELKSSLQKRERKGEKLTSEMVRYKDLRAKILSGEDLPDLLIACGGEGALTEYATEVIEDYFQDNPDINLAYADEDVPGEDGSRIPWLKSDWAPDTFLSTFYFGNIFVIRTSILLLLNPGARTASEMEGKAQLQEEDMREWIYRRLCMRIAQADGGFTPRVNGKFPIGHIREVLFHADKPPVPWNSNLISTSLTGRFNEASAKERMVSIIIPSRDNIAVLKRCIETIEQYTHNAPYELIIVDNGSAKECKEEVERLVASFNENGQAEYIYEPMEFNFSRMCNLGARKANGELLLFLNDDIEIRRPGWLSYMSEKAKLPYVGAVGMKLLYPNSDVIQHAGVVNVRVGPIHKLQYLNNTEEWYFGFNKGVRNVIAVTGACLMMRTGLFEELGGFDEEQFAVSFNDIDLCYRAFEKGYYNVVRNNMYLYHHESLSRGDDRKDEVKSLRLSREQMALLTKHEELFGIDPFYHPYLTQNPAVSRFEIGLEDEQLREPVMAQGKKLSKPYPSEWEDEVLRLGVEYANAISNWFDGPFAGTEKTGYYIKGYAFVIDGNNAVYERKLLFRNEKKKELLFEVPVEDVYREDIADNLTNQINEYLTGFSAVVPVGSLPSGTYEIGMIAVDKTGRGRIVNWSDAVLTVQ